jgi:hypothetical protein
MLPYSPPVLAALVLLAAVELEAKICAKVCADRAALELARYQAAFARDWAAPAHSD